MTPLEFGRRTPTVTHALFGALLAGIALYLVPALALDGRTVPAIVAVVVWLGIATLWFLFRRHLSETAGRQAREREAHRLNQAVLEQSSESHVVLAVDGSISFVSDNVGTVCGIDPAQLDAPAGVLGLVRESDRWRALRAFAKVRRQPVLALSLEVGGWDADGSDCSRSIRITNLVESPAVRGLLVSVRDNSPRKTFESEIQHLAYYDALTGLANRRFFFEQGAKALSLARRHAAPAAVFYMDLDQFKQVNDVRGYDEGDELLVEVARSFQRSLRDTDIVARLGGDEFAILLTEVRDEEAAGRVGRRILENMPALRGEQGQEVAVGASLGVSIFPADGDDLESLLKAADVAMYRAKTEATGIQFYRPELRNVLDERTRLEQQLKRGLERHEFQLHYQPVFQLDTGQMVGAEALSRWRHFARGMVVAADFIEMAERSGLIRSLDRWAVARAVHQRGTGMAEMMTGWVAVNLSPQSVADPGFVDYLRGILDGAGLPAGSLVLEMPESAVFNDTDDTAALMWELKNAGVAIALDDFGMGATSFARLKRLPIDIVKLHPQFVGGIGRDEGDEHLVQATVAIAHGMRAKVLAKGVEREDQVKWLREVGCDLIQGYLMGAPVPAGDLGKAAETA